MEGEGNYIEIDQKLPQIYRSNLCIHQIHRNVILLLGPKIISSVLYECTYLQNTGLHKFNLIAET